MFYPATVGPLYTCADKHKLGHNKIILCFLTKTFQCMFYPATVEPLYTCADKHKLGHNKIILCFLFTDQNISMWFFSNIYSRVNIHIIWYTHVHLYICIVRPQETDSLFAGYWPKYFNACFTLIHWGQYTQYIDLMYR